MSLQQSVFPIPKLLYRIMRQQRQPVSAFSPFSIQIDNVYADEKQLSRFQRLFGEPDSIPTFAFITAFKASLQCLAQAPIASSLLGLIHISSEVQIHQRHNWLMPFNVKVTVNKCEDTDKGLLYQITTDFYQRGKLSLTNINQMLDKRKHYVSKTHSNESSADVVEYNDISSWHVSLKTAWRYAFASGDINPIHLHPILAKPFGMRSALIHGMYNASRAIQEANKVNSAPLTQVLIEFNRPCYLGSDVVMKQDKQDANRFALFSADGQDRFVKLTLSYV